MGLHHSRTRLSLNDLPPCVCVQVASYDPQLAEDLLGMLVWPGVNLTQVLDAAEVSGGGEAQRSAAQ